MKKSLLFLMTLISVQLSAQELVKEDNQSLESVDTIATKAKFLSVGVKIGMPNIAGGNVEVILPVLDHHLAPYIDFSGIDINPEEDTEVGIRYSEFGINYYFGNKGKGFYIGAGLGNLATDIAFSNIEVENENGNSVNDGIGTIKTDVSTTNLKLGIKSGGRVYCRFELGYGFGAIPSSLEINATSASQGFSETIEEPFPEIPGVSEGGVVIGNIGFGISF